MTSLWHPLRQELAACAEAGLRLPLWWRDDDATEPSLQLERLHSLAIELDMPVHLAIVPATANPTLGPWLDGGPFRGVVHGWAHRNHAPPGMKSSEFGTPRPAAAEEAARGLARLRALFGATVHAMFVPPWNRIDPDLVPLLPAAGYHLLSTFGPRPAARVAPGLTAINTHVDPVDWRGTRGLTGPDAIVAGLVAHVAARRTGEADAQEPLGLLTHHLMMDAPTWDFCRGLLTELRSGPIDLFDIATPREPI